MTAMDACLDDLLLETWQWAIVETAMFAHATHADCRGWTIGHGSMCRAWCGHCGWEIAPRMDGSRGAAVFAMVALSTIGATFVLINAELARSAEEVS